MHKENPLMAWLGQYPPNRPRINLERVETLLEYVQNPHLTTPVVHIGGTNGKGSTIAFLTSLLMEAGFRVGVFSTPYMTTYQDQITINRVPIGADVLEAYIEKYKKIFAQSPKNSPIHGMIEFELLTVIAFDYFSQSNLDFVIMEVGLGGLLDSTNVCRPILTGITTIGLDHIDILGRTLEEVAAQKAGIIKEGVPLVTGNIGPGPLGVIEERASDLAAPTYGFARDYRPTYRGRSARGEVFDYWFPEGHFPKGLDQVHIPLLGPFQVENAAMALCLFEVLARVRKFSYTRETIEVGLAKTKWPARMEVLSQDPLVLLDGAHNPHAMVRLREGVLSLFPDKQVHILLAAIRTKEIREILDIVHTIPHQSLTVTNFDHPQAYRDQDLIGVLGPEDDFQGDWRAYMEAYLDQPRQGQVLLIIGSLYFASQARPYILERLSKN